MPKTSSLAKALQEAFPELLFEVSEDFSWSPTKKTVYFCDTNSTDGASSLLHETAHGLLKHVEYDRDISLLGMERDAWTYAQEKLASRFGLSIDPDFIEDSLDSYRDWLHARSLCPHCAQTGVQATDRTYTCLGCNEQWQVNEARRCGLRRYKIHKTKTPVS